MGKAGLVIMGLGVVFCVVLGIGGIAYVLTAGTAETVTLQPILATSDGGAPTAAAPPGAKGTGAAPRPASPAAVKAGARPPGAPDTIPIDAGDPSVGKPTASVTIVEFSDFQCSFCSRAAKTVDEVVKQYGPDDVRHVWKHFPLAMHKNARPTAEAATYVFFLRGNDAFWKFHDLAFANQRDLNPASYAKWAAAVGAPAAAFDKPVPVRSQKKVESDVALGKSLGVTGTPAFYINGILLRGAQPKSRFEAVINQELARAKEVIASGTPREKVHDVRFAANLGKVP